MAPALATPRRAAYQTAIGRHGERRGFGWRVAREARESLPLAPLRVARGKQTTAAKRKAPRPERRSRSAAVATQHSSAASADRQGGRVVVALTIGDRGTTRASRNEVVNQLTRSQHEAAPAAVSAYRFQIGRTARRGECWPFALPAALSCAAAGAKHVRACAASDRRRASCSAAS